VGGQEIGGDGRNFQPTTGRDDIREPFRE